MRNTDEIVKEIESLIRLRKKAYLNNDYAFLSFLRELINDLFKEAFGIDFRKFR